VTQHIQQNPGWWHQNVTLFQIHRKQRLIQTMQKVVRLLNVRLVS